MEQATGLQMNEVLTGKYLPENLRSLERLSWNYWWSWGTDGAAVFRELDPTLWEKTEQNPRRMLQEISQFHLWQRACDAHFVARVEELTHDFDDYLANKPRVYGDGTSRPITPENPVAYFCAEYGVHNSLPLYSGGLGILAGDHLKSASDLCVPLVAVGLFYRYGYFRQRINADNLQHEIYQESVSENLAIQPVLNSNNEPVKISLQMRGRTVVAQAWLAQVGRISLYLLDTNVAENAEVDRYVTGHLYGGDKETRVVQEMLLGIGGVRLLRKLNIEPSVFHLNEGHSAFLTLELSREITESQQHLSFKDAAKKVRERCVFTTHTPVSAGNDEFSTDLLDECFDDDFLAGLNLSKEDFFSLGRINPDDDQAWFGMTPLSLRMCRKANGVSRKHGEVSRRLWQQMYGVEAPEEVPITHITNGVHAPTWIAPLLKDMYRQNLGANWLKLLGNGENWRQAVEQIPAAQIWRVHSLLKNQLIAFIRDRAAQNLARNGEPTETARNLFEPAALTIGFARRVAAYKRWNLLLAQPERLLELIDSTERPVQFVFAGKAHPQDRGAKVILQNLLQNRQNSSFDRRAIFLEDYDQEMARYLVTGVDVWMNVPRRPLEASGTSGEKAAMNGVLNFSILDGWWIEGYDGTNGFAISEEGELSDDFDENEIDETDANSLYEILEQKIVPTFYERDGQGLPSRWVEMMRRSL
ncbi:MAG: alpha-glucan family phosphorylase, partial [Pyrinomonadaceae bacterium]